MCICDYAYHNIQSHIAKNVAQAEDEVMITEHLNPHSTGCLCSATVEHMHRPLRSVVAEIPDQRKYTDTAIFSIDDVTGSG